jgi:hypothetical protein
MQALREIRGNQRMKSAVLEELRRHFRPEILNASMK